MRIHNTMNLGTTNQRERASITEKLLPVLILSWACLALPTLVMAQAGSLDPTFGTNGIVTTANTGANAAALQSDGKIVVAGSVSTSQNSSQPGILRYNTNGTLDASFGAGGQVSINGVDSGAAFAIAIQSDGKILAAAPVNIDLEVLRFNTNGSPDTSFGSNGVEDVEAPGNFLSPANGGIVLQSDGKILVAAKGFLVRLLTNGQLDSTFGSSGVAPLVNAAQALALLPSGESLVLNGGIVNGDGVNGTASRYSTNGSIDSTFGVAGQAPGLGLAGGIAVLTATSKFMVAGSLTISPSLTIGGGTSAFLLVRYNSVGTLDNTFGSHGGVATPFPGNLSSTALAVAIQSNGDIVAAGLTAPNSLSPTDFALARYTSSGKLDTTFGSGGLVTTAFGSGSNLVNSLLIQADGKIVAVGNSNGATTIARYLAQ
jgi:uncharacterized delta-60 repeat protein